MTSQRTRTAVIAAAIVAAIALISAVVLVVTLAGSSSDQQHGGRDDSGHVDGPTPGNADAATATQQALSAMFSWQPKNDSSPGAAATRALPWLGGELAASANTPPATGMRELPEWAAWRAAGDIVSASVLVTDNVDTTPGRAVCEAVVTQTVLHRDGTSTRYRQLKVRAVLESTSDGWRMTEYNAAPTR